jgi:hypothetical protein
MGLQNNSQALPVPLLHLHIRLHFHQTEWAPRDIPRKLVKQYHQRHYRPHLSTRRKMPGHAPELPHEGQRTGQSPTFFTCQTKLCRW